MTHPNPAPASTGDPSPAPTTPPAGDPQAPPNSADEPLREPGLRALQEEREARKALEQRLAALAPLEKLAQALAPNGSGNGKSEVELLNERFEQYERDLAQERAARLRTEVAHEKNLPTALAARLQGSTREELEADADALLALLPAAPGTPPPPGPRPDPAQGARPGQATSGKEAGLAEARRRFGDPQKTTTP